MENIRQVLPFFAVVHLPNCGRAALLKVEFSVRVLWKYWGSEVLGIYKIFRTAKVKVTLLDMERCAC